MYWGMISVRCPANCLHNVSEIWTSLVRTPYETAWNENTNLKTKKKLVFFFYKTNVLLKFCHTTYKNDSTGIITVSLNTTHDSGIPNGMTDCKHQRRHVHSHFFICEKKNKKKTVFLTIHRHHMHSIKFAYFLVVLCCIYPMSYNQTSCTVSHLPIYYLY